MLLFRGCSADIRDFLLLVILYMCFVMLVKTMLSSQAMLSNGYMLILEVAALSVDIVSLLLEVSICIRASEYFTGRQVHSHRVWHPR